MQPRHRLFAYLLLLRRPIDGELAEIDAVLRWLWAKRYWLLGAYALMFWLKLVPLLTGDYDPAFRVFKLALTHLTIWIYACIMAVVWIGFRGYNKFELGGAPVWLLLLVIVCGFLEGLLGREAWSMQEYFFYVDTQRWETLGEFVFFLLIPVLVVGARRREQRAVERAVQAEVAGERLARKTTEADLRLLQAQVEPHFLYNTLANLRYLVQKDSVAALRMTDALIEYLRTSVPDIRALHVPLGREADHARHYLEIMQMRMGDRLAFTVDVPDDLRAIEVPSLLLLTLVENAIKHGIAPQVVGGEVGVRARARGDTVEVEVVDTGAGMGANAAHDGLSTGVGLENLRSRLQLTYGTPIAVELAPNTPQGTRVLLQLPRVLPESEAATIVVAPSSATAGAA